MENDVGHPSQETRQLGSDVGHRSHKENRWKVIGDTAVTKKIGKVIGDTPVIKKTGGKRLGTPQ